MTDDASRRGPGGPSGVVPPVPFPNTVVKRPSANDTAWATAWDNRPVPGPSLDSLSQPAILTGRRGRARLPERQLGEDARRHVDNRRVVGSVTI